MKRLLLATVLLAAVASLVGLSVMSQNSGQADESGVVSEGGIHWHPLLTILIKGQQQVIPANIGVGSQYANNRFYDTMMSMTNIHTHDANGTLHWEVMAGPVMKSDVMLGDFFEIWGQPFSSTQILDSKNGPDGTVTMMVNGQPNADYQNYQVKDGDKIEIRYE